MSPSVLAVHLARKKCVRGRLNAVCRGIANPRRNDRTNASSETPYLQEVLFSAARKCNLPQPTIAPRRCCFTAKRTAMSGSLFLFATIDCVVLRLALALSPKSVGEEGNMVHRPKVTLIAVASFVLGLALPTLGNTERAQQSNGIYYLELEGTPSQMGREYGRAMKKEIHAQVTMCRSNVKSLYGEVNGERFLNHLADGSKFLAAVKKYTPDVYTEMSAMADSAGVKLTDILLVNMYDELYTGAKALGIQLLPREPAGKCTTLACAHRRGLANLNGQNMDWDLPFVAPLVVHYTYPSGRKLLMYTFAGQVGGLGLNSDGLSAMCNSLPAGSTLMDEGLGSEYVLRGMLGKSSVAEALEWLGTVDHNASYNYSLADLNDACMVEVSPKVTSPIRLEISRQDGFRAHTNHAQALKDRNPIEGTDDKGNPVGNGIGNTLNRERMAVKQLSVTAGKTTMEDLQRILTTRPVNQDVTQQSIIVVHDPNDLRVYTAAGNDPKRKWNLYRFK